MKEREKWYCLSCAKEHEFKGHSYTHKFCDNKCQADYRYKIDVMGWLEDPSTMKSFSRWAKRYLIELRGYKCEVCMISEWNDQPLSLECDHIDGNSENNQPSNVRLICPNCHSQTETYKAKNKGNGRHSRRSRYALGKSF